MATAFDLEEFRVGYFDDERIDRRSALLSASMYEQSSVALRRLGGGSRAQEVGFNRLVHNEKFRFEELVRFHLAKTENLASSSNHILLMHDGSELCFGQVKTSQRRSLGPINNDDGVGFLLHPVMAIDAESKACLGLACIDIWTRPVKPALMPNERRNRRRELPIEEKESFHWISAALEARANIPTSTKVTLIGDRESDIYEYFDRVADDSTWFISRSCYDRCLQDREQKLFATLSGHSACGSYGISLPAISGKRARRDTTIEVKYLTVRLPKPPKAIYKQDPAPYVDLFVVEAKEVDHEGNKHIPASERLHWRLLTNHEINDFAKACWIIESYKSRWLIEQLFRTLKSAGLDMESCQIEDGDTLKKMAVLALVSSIRIMQLTLARDGDTGRPAIDVFGQNERDFLGVLNQSLQGQTEKQKNPFPEDSLGWASWVIARLGGWKGYKSERPPGPITMRNGLDRFGSLKAGWDLANTVKEKPSLSPRT